MFRVETLNTNKTSNILIQTKIGSPALQQKSPRMLFDTLKQVQYDAMSKLINIKTSIKVN